MSNQLIEFYKLTLGPEMASLVESAMDAERDRIIKIIESQAKSDCCWQYHSSHVGADALVKQIMETSKK
jgi:hypothetical protein